MNAAELLLMLCKGDQTNMTVKLSQLIKQAHGCVLIDPDMIAQ
ncbi:hypothetical protein SAMN05444062_101592 [Pseudomonas syringae]|nr:hypothetical protein [Pseudomonas syringae]SFG82803.1 hypothetical protein SAMN05444062_101592 [Pseudomonas syringae]